MVDRILKSSWRRYGRIMKLKWLSWRRSVIGLG